MRFIITGRGMTVTDGLREAASEKLGRLDKFFAPDTEVNVTMSVQKERQIVEVTVHLKGHVIRTEQESDDMYVSIDLAREVIERQLKKYRGKLLEKKHVRPDFSKDYVEDDEAYDYLSKEPPIKIVRSKNFGIKPMTPNEACVEMELIGHNFFVFLNSDTDQVNVVYKRKDNTYGLIEPEVD